MKSIQHLSGESASWTGICHSLRVSSYPVGLRILAFRPLSGKLKKHISQRSPRLCGENYRPFRVNIKPPFLGEVIDFSQCETAKPI